MIEYENNCVGCDHCGSCGRDHEKIIACDVCGDYADYHTNEGGFCEDCLEKLLNSWWEESTIDEKIDFAARNYDFECEKLDN